MRNALDDDDGADGASNFLPHLDKGRTGVGLFL